MITGRLIQVTSRLTPAIVSGISGGLVIGCSFPVMIALAEFLVSTLSRPAEVSPTVVPTSDRYMWIALTLYMSYLSIIVPLLLAVTGTLSVKMSRKHIPDVKSCVLISYAAGLISIVSGIVIYDFLTGGILMRPSMIDWFTSPGAIAIMLLSALISPAGGILYWQATKPAPAR